MTLRKLIETTTNNGDSIRIDGYAITKENGKYILSRNGNIWNYENNLLRLLGHIKSGNVSGEIIKCINQQ